MEIWYRDVQGIELEAKYYKLSAVSIELQSSPFLQEKYITYLKVGVQSLYS